MSQHLNRTGTMNTLASRSPGRLRPARRGLRPAVELLESRELLAVAIAELILPSTPPVGETQPGAIVAGPDGNLWFTEAGHKIGRLTLDGTITEFAVPGTGRLVDLTAGPDGNVWFLDDVTSPAVGGNAGDPPVSVKIGRITPDGRVTDFPVPSAGQRSSGSAITVGSDGNLWATLRDQVARITPAGEITTFPLGFVANAKGIISGSDGKLWFIVNGTMIANITTDGVVSVVPTRLSGHYVAADGLALSADGAIIVALSVGFSGPDTNHMDLVYPDGTIKIYSGFAPIQSIATDVDGRFWTTQHLPFGPGQHGPFRIEGGSTRYSPPTEGPYPGVITRGPDGNLWFTEPYANRIGKIDLNAPDPQRISVSGDATLRSTRGVPFQGQVASFTPLYPDDTPANYVAKINWGDGAPFFALPSYGTIVADGHGGMVVNGAFTYAASGAYSISVTILDVRLSAPGSTGTVTSTLQVADASLIPLSMDVNAYRGQDPFIVVAGATMLDPTGTFTATIDWGDGTTSTGVLAGLSWNESRPVYVSPLSVTPTRRPDRLSVAGRHVYSTDGLYTVRVRIEDQNGLIATAVSTLHYGTLTITATYPRNVAVPLNVAPDPWIAVGFALSAPGVAASEFTATIDYGDGSPPTDAFVRKVGDAAYEVLGSHVYRLVGYYLTRVMISIAGQLVEARGQVQVYATSSVLAGRLDLASDTGTSNHDGITLVTQPHFQGVGTPGTMVQLVAWPIGGTSSLSIGQARVGEDGRWSILSTELPIGRFTITAKVVDDGITLEQAPIETGDPENRLEIVRSLTVGGGLDPASDTGTSNHDGMTLVTQPHFQGTGTPGALVQLIAWPADGSSPFVIGQAVADDRGAWSVVSIPLAEGAYAIVANASARGQDLLSVQVLTGEVGDRLVIDTSAPRITSARVRPGRSQLELKFEDNLTPLNLQGLLARGVLRFVRILPRATRVVPVRRLVLEPKGASVLLGRGRTLAAGRYLMQLDSSSVRDEAGNPLAAFFQGRFNVRRSGAAPALPLVSTHSKPPRRLAMAGAAR